MKSSTCFLHINIHLQIVFRFCEVLKFISKFNECRWRAQYVNKTSHQLFAKDDQQNALFVAQLLASLLIQSCFANFSIFNYCNNKRCLKKLILLRCTINVCHFFFCFFYVQKIVFYLTLFSKLRFTCLIKNDQ